MSLSSLDKDNTTQKADVHNYDSEGGNDRGLNTQNSSHSPLRCHVKDRIKYDTIRKSNRKGKALHSNSLDLIKCLEEKCRN